MSIVHSLKNKTKASARKAIVSMFPRVANPWPAPRGPSVMDPGIVRSDTHILDLNLQLSLADYKLFVRYGLNLNWDTTPPSITEHPEVIVYRAVYLKELAKQINAQTLCEVGTGRGWQTMTWAHYLAEQNNPKGIIFTCDIAPHDVPIYPTPVTGNETRSRKDLWAEDPASERISPTHGESAVMAQRIDRPIDVLYIDGEHTREAVLADYHNLERHLAPKSIVIFDDCDARYPGIEEAVSEIVSKAGKKVDLVSFWPSHYKIAVLFNEDNS